jgi:dipeptidyl aminopeptidase/acylaminoacyl peptidase
MLLRSALVALSLAIPLPLTAAPLEAFGHLPSVEDVEISPDGSTIALVASDAENHQVRFNRTNDLSFILSVQANSAKIIGLQWVGSNHLIIVSAKTERSVELADPREQHLFATDVDLATRTMQTLLQERHGQVDAILGNIIMGWPQPAMSGGKPVAMLEGVTFAGYGKPGRLTFFRDELDARSVTAVVIGGGATQSFVADPTGNVVGGAEYNGKDWVLAARTKDDWKTVHSETAPYDPPVLRGLGRSVATLMVEKDENGVRHYHEQPIAGGDWSPPIALLDDTTPIYDPVRRTVIGGYRADELAYRYAFFDPAEQKIWDAVARAFPGETVKLSSWTDDRSKIVLQVEGPRSGAAYYLLDTRTHRADWIADKYQGVTSEDLGEVRAIRYPASDGTIIPAYLTIPHGATAKNLPLVVLPHGGPNARDNPGFDWWAQAIASLGYAVLQPQYRGSTGIAPGLETAGYGQYGRKMLTDMSDGVAFLARNGTIDPAQVCIVGGSYGGYAAMAGVTLQSGIYRCAVAVAGISDLRRQFDRDTGGGDNPARWLWLRRLGAKSNDDPVFDELSPARHAAQLSVPLLLIHGSIDTVVDPVQSRIMQEEAAKAGKTVQFVTLKHEDHNLSFSPTRLEMLQAMADFLKANLPAAPPSQSATK